MGNSFDEDLNEALDKAEYQAFLAGELVRIDMDLSTGRVGWVQMIGRIRRSSVSRITPDLIAEARRRGSTSFYMEIAQEEEKETWQERGYRIAGPSSFRVGGTPIAGATPYNNLS